jgi:hypothetical protein
LIEETGPKSYLYNLHDTTVALWTHIQLQQGQGKVRKIQRLTSKMPCGSDIQTNDNRLMLIQGHVDKYTLYITWVVFQMHHKWNNVLISTLFYLPTVPAILSINEKRY